MTEKNPPAGGKKPEKQSGKVKSSKIGLAIISILIVFCLGYFFGYISGSGRIYNLGILGTPNFGILSEAAKKIEKNYIGKYNQENLIYGALDGMLVGLGDPYSGIIRANNVEEFYQEIEGEFEGIGIEIGKKDGEIIIIAPLSGYPAETEGVLAGDKIIEVDHENISDFTLDEVVSMIRGEAGTSVHLKIYRTKTDQLLDFEIKREKIEVESVSYEIKDGIGYIRIIQFDSSTKSGLDKAVKKLEKKNLSGIILDLRDNPGGYLDTAIDVAEVFLEKNQVIMYEQKKNGKLKTYKNDKDGKLKDFPLVILQSQGSASGSEIVIAAICDNRKEVQTIGMKTFGKGLVQEMLQLSDKSLMRLSTARWLTPKKHDLNEKGWGPNIEIDISEDDLKNSIDTQKNKAVEILGAK